MSSPRLRRLGVVLAIALLLAPAQNARADASDAWITTKVKISLLTAEGVSARNVNVDTVDGRVTLHGTVSSDAEKAKAESVAKSVQGVRDLRNLLQVKKTQEEAGAQAASDEQIKKNVSDALARDPALEGTAIRVSSVNRGVVLLSGKARSLSEHLRAIQTASDVNGVRRVASEIESPDQLADAEIWREGKYDKVAYDKSTARDIWTTTEAKMRLLVSPDAPAIGVNVDSENGVVTLFGMVDSEAAKNAAAAEVRKVDGVKEVKNALQVVPPAQQEAVKQQDQEIRSAAEKSLRDRSELADSNVQVEVSKGVARLTGTVKQPNDRMTALIVARSTPGVRSVIDDLRLATPEVAAPEPR